MQAYDEFRKLGFGHVLWLTNAAEKCERSARLLPELGCAWSTQDLGLDPAGVQRHWEPGFKMHMDRIAYLGRSLRFNYSVLMVEADTMLFHDPYPYLKSWPLRDINFLTMRDANGWVNPGVMYVQNSRPGGAVAYAINEIIDRALRWMENATLLASKKPPRPTQCWDMSMLSDSVLGGIVGRPLFFHCWEPQEAGPARQAWVAAHEAVVGVKDLALAKYLYEETVPWPANLSVPSAPTPSKCSFFNGTLRVPNTKGKWPEELGGIGYDRLRVNAAGEYIARLAEDNPILWPDPEDPDKEADCASITETFGYLPRYFVQPWGTAGASGWWNQALVGPKFPTVMAHIVHAPGGSSNKLTVRMANHRYNWNLAHIAKAQEGVFFASSRNTPVPDVIAYAPEVAQQEWGSLQQLQDAIQALVLLGVATNRTVAFPSAPCNASWLAGDGAKKLPLQIDAGRYIAYGDWGNLRCMWYAYLYYDCLQAKDGWPGGLLPTEFEHYLRLVPEEELHLRYSREDMLMVGKGRISVDRNGSSSTSGNAVLVDLDASLLVEKLNENTDRRLLWLGAVPRLKFVAGSLPAPVLKVLSQLRSKQCFTAHRRRSSSL